jgi:polyisoprenoid-binding protein YceI
MTTSETGGVVSPLATLLADGSAVGTWELDPESSSVAFEVKHFWGLITVRGRFTHVEGSLNVDPAGSITGTMRIDAASVTTGNRKRDEHLRSADFFDAANHAWISFSGRQVTPSPSGAVVAGELTAAGRTQPVEFTADLGDATSGRVTVEALIPIDRTAFGMTWSPLGMASAHVLVVVHAELVRP